MSAVPICRLVKGDAVLGDEEVFGSIGQSAQLKFENFSPYQQTASVPANRADFERPRELALECIELVFIDDAHVTQEFVDDRQGLSFHHSLPTMRLVLRR